MKAKPFTSFARALLRGQDFSTPAFFLPLFGSFFQSIWSGPQESAPWFVFPPIYTWANWSSFPVAGGFPRGIFLEWAAVLFLNPSSTWPQTKQISLDPQMNAVKSSLEMRWTWQAAAQFASLERCTPALPHCCRARVWLRDLRLPDCWTKILIEIKGLRAACC